VLGCALCAACGRSELYQLDSSAGAPGVSGAGRSGSGGAAQAGTVGVAGRRGTDQAGASGTLGGGGTSGAGFAGSFGRAGAQAVAGFGGSLGFGGRPGLGGFASGGGGTTSRARCNNGVLELGEECDDGNFDGTDACTNYCTIARCGDGIVWQGHETCDDKNTLPADGCSASCRIEPIYLAIGQVSACAVSTQGQVKCWGFGVSGQLGLGDNQARGLKAGQMGANLPYVDVGPYHQATEIVSGAQHVCVISGGLLYCWGDNADGELGLGDNQSRGDQPREMGQNLPAVGVGYVLAAAAGLAFTCAIDEYLELKCWGANLSGQLGRGDTAFRGLQPGEIENLAPVDLGLGLGAKPIQVALGNDHACALLAGGEVKCWGANSRGQLGLGDTQARGSEPGQMGANLPAVALGGGTIVKVGAASNRSCALFANGTLKCWGSNELGQLGLGDLLDRGTSPGQMGENLNPVDLGDDVVDFGMGELHTCALLLNRTVKCWGWNQHGQLGLPGATDRGSVPGDMGVNLPAVDLGGVPAAIFVGGSESCVRFDDARVKCWGYNNAGQLGLGDNMARGDSDGQMGDNLPYVDIGF